ncbi:hypothetical protein SporoP33_03440 [Sporosarcina sp. P33]|nr:hypothetical protein SporoP33_03440 [Sporosarcina sp. P33]
MTRHLPKHTLIVCQSLVFIFIKKATWIAPSKQRRHNCGVGRSHETTGALFASWLMTKGNPPRACAGPKSRHSLTSIPDNRSSNDHKTRARTALNSLRRWRMASAMSQTGSAPGCLIATPTACKAPPFNKWKADHDTSFAKAYASRLPVTELLLFKRVLGLLPLSSAGTTAGSAEVMRQLARSSPAGS